MKLYRAAGVYQCQWCGLRLDDKQEIVNAHLDMHFYRRRAQSQTMHRGWYAPVTTFTADNKMMTQIEPSSDGDTKDAKNGQSVVITSDEDTETVCQLCRTELPQIYFDHEVDEWCYADCIRVKNGILHQSCHELSDVVKYAHVA